ncbi:MAG: CDP-alcohol phosphatidyltransferase [Bacteroidales bacterium]|nr:CDP-alcohol phosphatidyltransferase [Bacteroidales bacterium]MDT8432231.1 CDP-alcohol phosphatidyltransferase [Bacteroidales bacterium]
MRSHHNNDIIKAIFRDRPRSNLLKKHEQKAISGLVRRIPGWINSDILTGIGLSGNIIVAIAFILASIYSTPLLLLGLVGFFISWFGDSLDGRLAYYRNIPRKHYGFTLDITIDWISIIIVGFGYIIYAEGSWELLGYGFVVMYGWEMILALTRYRLTDQYVIDSGKMGPTEVRLIICTLLITEVLLPGSLYYLAAVVVAVLFLVNIIDTVKLLKLADEFDRQEKAH